VRTHPDHPGSIAVLLTSDEEGDAIDGTAAVVELLRSRGESLDFCLLGEPTSSDRLGDALKNGRRGSLNGVMTVKGVQGHVAYPDLARNPIHIAMPALAELTSTIWDQGDESFGPTTLQISNMHAGTGANNVIPGHARRRVQFPLLACVAGRDAEDSRARDPGSSRRRTRSELDAGKPAVLFAARTPCRSAEPRHHRGDGISAGVLDWRRHVDGRFLIAISGELAEFGPSNATIHAIDERVRVADIAPLSVIFEQTIAGLLSKS
jgi:succinyl-diaminopimelate desuccinylase